MALIDLAEFSVDEKGLVSSTINFRIKMPVDPLSRIGLPVTGLQTRNERSQDEHSITYEPISPLKFPEKSFSTPTPVYTSNSQLAKSPDFNLADREKRPSRLDTHRDSAIAC